uniref:Uncharacterized protein n=1 Tax=Anguilla anguilla TaxID=7936 RepID=A0A0E9RGD1_ANGAN
MTIMNPIIDRSVDSNLWIQLTTKANSVSGLLLSCKTKQKTSNKMLNLDYQKRKTEEPGLIKVFPSSSAMGTKEIN